jgi:diacylglycerol kinase family enzyme
MTDQKFLFIVNPHAHGSRTGRDWEKTYSKISDGLLFDNEFIIADGIGTGVEASLDAAKSKDYTSIISVGGEGSSNEVLNGIYQSGNKSVKLGFIRSGTVNDYLSSIEWPGELEKNIAILNRGETRLSPITLTKADVDRVALNAADTGIAAKVAYMASVQRKLAWIKGNLRYTLLALRAVASWKNIEAVVKVDDREFSGGLSMMMGGFTKFNGGYKMFPHVNLFGDKMAYLVVYDFNRLTMIKKMGTLEKGEHDESIPGVYMGHTDKMTVDAEEPILFEVDGEPFSFNTSKIEVQSLPKAIDIYNPDGI